MKIGQVFDTTFIGIVKATAPLQRTNRATVSIGAKRERGLGLQQQLTGRRIDRRHGSLFKNTNVVSVQTQIVVLFKVLLGWRIGCFAGHDVKRDVHAVQITDRNQPICKKLKQSSARDRSDRKHSFGLIKPQPSALSASDQYSADFACFQCFFAARLGVFVGPFRAGSVGTHRGWWFGVVCHRGKIRFLVRPSDQGCQLFQIQILDLRL